MVVPFSLQPVLFAPYSGGLFAPQLFFVQPVAIFSPMPIQISVI